MHGDAAARTTRRTVPGEMRMKVEFTPEQERLRRELRAYFKALITPELLLFENQLNLVSAQTTKNCAASVATAR